MPSWLAVLLFSLVAATVLGLGVAGLRRDLSLRRGGARAQGEIVSISTSRNPKGGGLSHPVVRWDTDDGRTMVVKAAIGRSWVGRFRPGKRVLVHYDPARPERMRIKGYAFLVWWSVTLVGALLLALSVVLAVQSAR